METQEPLKPLKTWSHLAERRKRPTEYEIVTTNLHYRQVNPDAPWEQDPNIHMNKWYRKYCNESPIKHEDWDSFRDPDQIVYRTYNIVQSGQESYVNSLFEQFSDREHDIALPKSWGEGLARIYTPARYLYHTLQLGSSYLAQIAPASTISTCGTFQTSDSLRWLTHTAYRTVELSRVYPDSGFAKNERNIWENDPIWQGFRELTENMLVAWDWAECFTAMNLVAKPAIEETLLVELPDHGQREGDIMLSMLSGGQMRDVERHRRWTKELVNKIFETEGNKPQIVEWLGKWMPMAEKAIDDYCQALPEPEESAQRIKARINTFHESLNLSTS